MITRLVLLTLGLLSASVAFAQQPSQQNNLENQVALQLGQMQLAISKANAIIADLQKQNADLKTKCGKPCETPPAPTAGASSNAGTPDKSVR